MAIKYTIKPLTIETFELDLDPNSNAGSLDLQSHVKFDMPEPQSNAHFDAGDSGDYLVIPAHALENLAPSIPSMRVPTPEEMKILQPQQSMTPALEGNLFGDNKNVSLIEVNNRKIDEYEDKVVIFDHENQGQLVIYIQAIEGHQPGDFVYLSRNPNASGEDSHFQYCLADFNGHIASFSLHLEFGESGPSIKHPDFTTIDEESLLSGAPETHMTSGYLGIDKLPFDQTSFAPLLEQKGLVDLELTSNGTPLYYSLTNNNHTLVASKGAHGDLVFEVNLTESGSYEFTLYDQIDRNVPQNLVDNNYFNLDYLLRKKWGDIDDMPGWQMTDLGKDDNNHIKMAVAQTLPTTEGDPYQLQFYYHPPASEIADQQEIQVYWGDHLVYTLTDKQVGPKGFSFALEAPAGDQTELKFVTKAGESAFEGTIDQISVTSTHQHQLPLPFLFSSVDISGERISSAFDVNVTTTPPLSLTNSNPLTIIYDQSVYQSIVVQDDNAQIGAQNTLDLQSLFDNMDISRENRFVSVIQQQIDGHATNIYEIQISDKNDHLEPITIADVKLSFPGGDGGLDVFYRNIHIDEGGGT